MKYGRHMRVTIGLPGEVGRTLSSVQPDGSPGLSMLFRVKRSASGSSSVEATIWGVGNVTMAALQEEGAACVLEAGYGANLDVVASGLIVPGSLRPDLDGRIWRPTWSVSDSRLDLSRLSVTRSWSTTNSDDVLEYLLGLSPLSRGSVAPGRRVTYSRGHTIASSLSSALREWADDTRSRISTSGGVFDAWPVGSSRQVKRITVSESSGMVGAPVSADNGRISVTTLYESGVRLGDQIGIDSRVYRGGAIVVEDLELTLSSGDDQPFYSTFTGGVL